ncbi:hypothetical protein [Tsukamurella sp. PLM1]|uniref:hypothetical protein n=1 Tax=Tsukamurella sp. PLM1 TaxID=2929795 RepID=UPI0020C0EEDE|nr:hypothetical protein [Tsukamurella sp. PLM1]
MTKPDAEDSTAAAEIDEPDRAAKPRPAKKSAEPQPKAQPGGIVVTPLALGLAAIVVVLAVAATAFGFLWQSAASDRDQARADLAAATATSDQNQRAQDVAKKYAIGAATIDYQNLAAWRTALTANTTSQLAAQLQQASVEFEQIVVPLQWQSTATPLGTIVASNKDGLIVVNVFLNMVTKSTQRPEGIPSTATYTLTIDTKQDWQISDVRGIDAALGGN